MHNDWSLKSYQGEVQIPSCNTEGGTQSKQLLKDSY